ncbi:MAG: peptide deformylase [Patescibacteria group bacterium]
MPKESGPLAITARNTTFHAADSFLMRRPAEPVYRRELHSDDTRMIVADLLNVAGATTNIEGDPNKRTMVGLHARQLGYDKNVFVFWSNYQPLKDRPEDYTPRFRVIINPQITHTSETTNDAGEACFSIDKVGSTAVPRADSIRFSGVEVDLDEFQRNGNLSVTQVEDEEISEPYIARIFQHEEHHGRGERFPAVSIRLNRKGKPDEQIPRDEEAHAREMSQPLPYEEPRTIVVMKNLKAA